MALNLSEEVFLPLYWKMVEKINSVNPYTKKRCKRNSIWQKSRKDKQQALNRAK